MSDLTVAPKAQAMRDDASRDNGARRVNTVACNECRKKRIKCSPYSPCQPCIDAGLECEANRGLDRRSKDARQRAREDSMKAPREALANTIKILRGDDTARAQALIRLIQRGASSHDFIPLLEHQAYHEDMLADLCSQSLIDAQETLHSTLESEPLSPTSGTPQSSADAKQSPINLEDPIVLLKRASYLLAGRHPVPLDATRESAQQSAARSEADQSGSQTDAATSPANALLSSTFPASEELVNAAHRQLLPFQQYVHTIPSFAMPDSSLISNLFFAYRDAAREMLAGGIAPAKVLGNPGQFDVELLLRNRKHGDPYDAASWACELTKKVENYDIFVLLASCAFSTAYMRWNVLPTIAHYSSMPSMIRPTQKQLLTPHSMSLDLVPLPAVRDHLIETGRDWLALGAIDAGDVSLGWVHGLENAVAVEPLTGRRVLTSEFVEHATNPCNWSVNSHVRNICPAIEAMGITIRSEVT